MRLRPPSLVRRERLARAVLVLTLGAGVLAWGAPVRAEPAPVPETVPRSVALSPPSPDLPGLPSTSIELALVPVESFEFADAAERYGEVDATHAAAQAERTEGDQTVTELRARVHQLEAIRASARARSLGLGDRLDQVEGAVQELAVAGFVAGGTDERLNSALASPTPAINEVDRRDLLGGLSMEALLSERAAYRSRLDEATQRLDAATAELATVRQALAELASGRAAAVDAELTTAADVARERVTYEEARVLAMVERVDFPLVALDAYHRAAGAMAQERPECGLRWWGLAGISRVEGRHGSYGGTRLQANGDTSPRIIGIQLDGTNSTAVVGDSDGGALDGDPAFDRAVGPMQFIPQTWARYQSDGNGDGTASPFNLYDATLATARHLCTWGRGLDGDDGLRGAYFSYNRSLPYVETVLGYARHYEQQVEVPGRPG